ncbi:MAG TPA: arsenite methyltransferase [Ignavibacteria bacterium]|nr:arsenite S-adenosylmethyltransferase [Bacteroidota bacterium]HRI84399.1 arsenite methyltransferase [Ignavibacteria bacterium]HRK00672.1 arsenite methyltransferase [Ignavibacteria bacterium]
MEKTIKKTEEKQTNEVTKKETGCCGPECCTDSSEATETLTYEKSQNSAGTKSSDEIKEMVKRKYSEIALQSRDDNASSCCGSGGCSDEVYNIMTDDYENLRGYNPDADLGLGCGLPTQFAKIKKGDTVLDLGSGAGNDCFVARAETGETGKVIGVDFSEAMIAKARVNAEKMKFNNIEFRHGEIEDLPVNDSSVDVVVSNCVLNLVPEKLNAFSEMYRVLKPGGHFSVSDIVLTGVLPEKIQSAAAFYAGCVTGAIQKNEYISLLEKTGFVNVQIQKEKIIRIPDDILKKYLTDDEVTFFNNSESGIFSITVYGEKSDY